MMKSLIILMLSNDTQKLSNDTNCWKVSMKPLYGNMMGTRNKRSIINETEKTIRFFYYYWTHFFKLIKLNSHIFLTIINNHSIRLWSWTRGIRTPIIQNLKCLYLLTLLHCFEVRLIWEFNCKPLSFFCFVFITIY